MLVRYQQKLCGAKKRRRCLLLAARIKHALRIAVRQARRRSANQGHPMATSVTLNFGRDEGGRKKRFSKQRCPFVRRLQAVSNLRVELHVSPQLQLALARHRSLSLRGSRAATRASLDTPDRPAFSLRATVVLNVGPLSGLRPHCSYCKRTRTLAQPSSKAERHWRSITRTSSASQRTMLGSLPIRARLTSMFRVPGLPGTGQLGGQDVNDHYRVVGDVWYYFRPLFLGHPMPPRHFSFRNLKTRDDVDRKSKPVQRADRIRSRR